jgi:chitinase
MDQFLDFWNLMAYDFTGSFHSVTGHQANLENSDGNSKCTPFSTQRAVEYYKSQGVVGSKIVIGMPLYGRAFEGTDGLGYSYSGVGQGSWENGVWDFKALPHIGAKELYDEDAKATYSYDAAKRTLVSYDTPHMARQKAQWIIQHGLGGAMWWESSGDGTGENSLIGNVVGVLDHLDRGHNCLDYPHSQFENLRKRFQA